ncbi:transcriptional regulator [Ensifer adhaerens]|nr:transcriptional regulator [Ensifer adhaerens]
MAVFKRLSISEIYVGDRARPIDEDHAQAIAASISERGLINPITVREAHARKGTPYTLVAGGHRLRATTILGLEEIDTIVVEANQEEAQLIELSENLYRNDLSPLDRALFVMKFREVWEEKNGKINPKGGRPAKQGNDYPVIYAGGRELSKQVCNRLGFGSESYKLVTRIGKNLHPALRQAVRGTTAEHDQSKLLKLAKLDAETQVKIAAALEHERDVGKVLSWTKPEKRQPSPEDLAQKSFTSLVTAWDAANADTRQRFLDHISQGGASFLEAAE